MNIVIGSGVEMKGTVKIMQGVTLGGSLGRERVVNDCLMVQPFINGQVFIGIGPCFFGPVVVQHCVFTSTNSVVTKDCSNTLVYGNHEYKALGTQHIKELMLDG